MKVLFLVAKLHTIEPFGAMSLSPHLRAAGHTVALLAEAGCYSVNVGIEAGNVEIRKRLLGRRMSNRTIVDACRLLSQNGIKVLANNMLGLPGCTFEHDLSTLRLNQRCRTAYSLAMLWQPYPRTKLASYAEENGYFDGDYERLDFSYYCNSHLDFADPMEKRKIENLQKWFAVAAMLPMATPLIAQLVKLPPNRIFNSVFRSVYSVFHQTEIFKHPLSVYDWIKHMRHIA